MSPDASVFLRIGGIMAEAHQADRPPMGSELDLQLVDLALSVNDAALWQFRFADHALTWMSDMDALLGVPNAAESDVRARLGELLAPLTGAARSASAWQELELEQPVEGPNGVSRFVRFRARRYGEADTGGLIGIAVDTTSTRGDRRALADLADRYRLLVELSPDSIGVHQDGVFVYVNPATVRLLAADSDARILGRPITDFVAAQGIQAMEDRLASLTTAGAASAPTEVELARLDGGTLFVETVSVRTTWQGRPAYQVIARDITAQKTAESALRYQAELVEHVSDAIVATDRDGVVTSWNPAAESVYGVPARQACGRHVSEVVGAELDPSALVASGGLSHATHRRADGGTLAVRVSASRMEDGFVLVGADETARRRAEHRFTTVVAALNEGVMVIGPTGTIESANPAAQQILGVTETDLLGSSTTSWTMFDEEGKVILPHAYPSQRTRHSGQPQHARVRCRRPDGRSVWLEVNARPLEAEDEPPHRVVLSFTDVTERRAIRQQLEWEATHDSLTALANRTVLHERLQGWLGSSHCDRAVAVLFLDLDQFKVINDSLGHGVGDQVLRAAGNRLRRAARASDLVARLGGDEFMVVTEGDDQHGDIRALAEKLRDELREPITVSGGLRLHVDASIGIVLVPPGDSRTAEDALRDADVAMYQAKALGRGRYAFFNTELRHRVQHQMRLEQELREAVPERQLWVAYQPIVDLTTERTVAVEGLLRWTHPDHGTIAPSEFISLAEQSDLINSIGRHMLGIATRDIACHRQRYSGIRLNANLSPRQLDDPDLVPMVRDTLEKSGLSARNLCLEVTETTLMHDPTSAVRALNALRDLGVSLAIDDFGTGYSSLAQLQRLPLDVLKIDRSFVAQLGDDHDDKAIVPSIITIAHAMGLRVVAEGAETVEQVEALRRLGCDQAQGYYLARPAPIDELPRIAYSATSELPRPRSTPGTQRSTARPS